MAGAAEVAVTAPRRLRPADIVAHARAVLAAVAAARPACPLACRLDLPDLRLTVRGEPGDLVDAIRRRLARAAAENAAEPPAELEVVLARPGLAGLPAPARLADPAPPPGAFSERLEAAGLDGGVFPDLDLWYLHDPERGLAIQHMARPEGYPPWETGAPLRLFLHWHYARRGRRLTHAGTLGRDGRGVLLAGAGGAGKSGTVAAGLIAGLSSVGDDYILLSCDADAVRARPLFTTLKQDPAGLARLGQTPPPGSRPNWQGKHHIPIEDLAGAPMPASLAIAAILLPRVTGAATTRLAPVSRREAMLALTVSSFQQMPGGMASGFRFFGALVQRLPCYRLDLGTDAAEIAATTADFLARGAP
jgi:hypothetical protein